MNIWTDGSYHAEEHKIGLASIVTTITEQYLNTTKFRSSDNTISSTAAEIEAILVSLIDKPTYSVIHQHTDSQTTIDNINSFTNPNISDSHRLKITNDVRLHAVTTEFHRFTHPPTLNKVKAHSGLRFNDLADKEAKLGRSLTNIPHIDFRRYTTS
ncbi:hypothetical protein BC833DRAFT_626517 [Globomyces pollinis-pini]|nr:hypothetical protein BC833DRAFT_626517 [Globomyces pollinis-pini]